MDGHLFPELLEGTNNAITVLLRLLPFPSCCLRNFLAMLICACRQAQSLPGCAHVHCISNLGCRRKSPTAPSNNSQVLAKVWQHMYPHRDAGVVEELTSNKSDLLPL